MNLVRDMIRDKQRLKVRISDYASYFVYKIVRNNISHLVKSSLPVNAIMIKASILSGIK